MGTAILLIVLVVVIVGGGLYFARSQAASRQRQLDDAKADARRLVERLGGQVLNITGTDTASQQAMADASERYNAAGSQMEQATTVEQARLVKDTAVEGLYYVRAARVAMGMDPGPALPDEAERERAGKVTERRDVDVEGQHYAASPDAGQDTPYYYPGGRVAGRPVPQGWYSEPWWKPALVAGAWGLGSMFLFSAMFSGMGGIASASAWESGYDAGQQDALESGDQGGDQGGDGGDGGDGGGFDGGDAGGQDFGGFDGGGFDGGGFDGGGFGGGGFDF
ncbi:hypothetical protein VSH64_23670 [Amycolatopsis rhabdoformis]|uniref:DUF1542 domain-containing protein n=1 Tax=Amycolatopsis rhabdoformis TaxID=1448059 RepID=A0ABZ1IP79_9PSEU|nr:hypothetical protein [Amycolatopsis rhabdoformis]WSE35033.1 hypothetical protein VSH64_23670 [Amycolatopsis rhabdoformis]